MSRGPDEPSDINERVITPRQLWFIVFGGVRILFGVGFLLLIAKLLMWVTR